MTYRWLMLLLAGFLEIGWAISLKMTDGWTKLPYLAVNVLFGLGAAFSLSQAMKEIPMGTAYIVWKGIAILGIVFYEYFYDHQPMTLPKAIFGSLVLIGIIGLKVIQPSASAN